MRIDFILIMYVKDKLNKLVKISYLSQEYQKLESYINVIRDVDCDTASSKDMLLELHVRLMAFLLASYNGSEKFPKTKEIKLARHIRNIYTHDTNDKVIKFDFKPINENKYCEPYIALNTHIDLKCENKKDTQKDECKNECKCTYKYYIKTKEQYEITIKDIFKFPTAAVNVDCNNLICINLFYFINTIYKQIQDAYILKSQSVS
jgi:hypothetical protein